MIVHPYNGRPISRPGVYSGVPMADYHGALTVKPSISSTGIRTIFDKSPAHYFVDSYLNPNREERKDTEAFRFGRAAHFLLLGEKGFRDQFIVRPKTYRDEEAKSQPWNGTKAYCKAWMKDAEAQGLTVITEADLDSIKMMAENLRREPLIKAGVLNGAIEHSLVWRDEETGVWLKARPDAMPAVDMCVADLKTANDITDAGIEKAISDHDLHVQAALVGMGLRALTGREMESFSLVFVEKAKPHCVRVRELTGADLALGEQQIRAVLPIFAKAVETGVWHGPGGGQVDAQYAEVTPWRRKAIERRLQVLASEASV
jgi:hypothetical protein